MDLSTLRDQPILQLNLFARSHPLRHEDATAALLAAFDQAGDLRPEESLGKFRGPFAPGSLGKQLARAAAAPAALLVSVDLVRAEPELRYSLRFDPEAGDFSLSATFLLSLFDNEARCERLCSLVRAVAAATSAVFARAHDRADLELADAGRPGTFFAPDQIDDVYWLTFWGPQLVERAGRERVLSTPAHRIEPLPGGGVLLLTRPTPVDFASPEARRAQAGALAHLRPDLPEGEIHERLLDRSRRLAPAARDWDADLADLLELTLHDVKKSDRPREAERLNAYRSPPVGEVRDAPLPADTDERAAEEAYGDYAEQLVALLHKDIPEVESFDQAALPRIDYHLWHFRFAEDYDRNAIEQDLVPALGAFVGQMMVEHLGGRWIPRGDLDQSQVVVGGRAYLPFLRARHALASRQSQIDHSMTKFFREAAKAAK